jgi:hypothetical protein
MVLQRSQDGEASIRLICSGSILSFRHSFNLIRGFGIDYSISTHRRRMQRSEAHSLAEYAANLVESDKQRDSSALRKVLFRCIQILYWTFLGLLEVRSSSGTSQVFVSRVELRSIQSPRKSSRGWECQKHTCVRTQTNIMMHTTLETSEEQAYNHVFKAARTW